MALTDLALRNAKAALGHRSPAEFAATLTLETVAA